MRTYIHAYILMSNILSDIAILHIQSRCVLKESRMAFRVVVRAGGNCETGRVLPQAHTAAQNRGMHVKPG